MRNVGYKTGNDFIHEDDFAENKAEFLKRSNQKDEEGNRLVANTEANGRFRSDWFLMMYPRLKPARNLFFGGSAVTAHAVLKQNHKVGGKRHFIIVQGSEAPPKSDFEPLWVVFRDTGFVSDAVKINVEQIFKQMSPHTEVKTI